MMRVFQLLALTLALSAASAFTSAPRGAPRSLAARRPAGAAAAVVAPPAGVAAKRSELMRRQAVEQVNAVELYGPVFAFAIGISVCGYAFAWGAVQIIEATDSYEMLGNLLAGEEEKKAFEAQLKKEQEEKAEAEAAAKLALENDPELQKQEAELELYKDY
mmetsp:Transcript_29227/g.93637  ORF Transcript_29227/g.93637 Transcript_29227/m.93637 type:complete len:161 (-) Transcript_29227:919-1401(-)